MRKNKRYILYPFSFSIPLLLALFVPYLMVMVFWWQQQAIRESLKEKFERTHISRIEIKNTDFIWMRRGKEILVGKRLFDIKKMEKGNDSTIFWGLYDDEESDLVENWLNTLGKSNENGRFHLAALIFLILGPSEKAEIFRIKIPSVPKQVAWSLLNLAKLPKGYTGQPLKPPSILYC